MKVVLGPILVTALLTLRFTSPLMVTPVSRLLVLELISRDVPPVKLTSPPLMVPPDSVHEPVALLSVSVLAPPPALIVPVTFTVPPVLLKVPMPPVASKVPLRFTIPPALNSIVPPLVHVPAGAMVRMPPSLAASLPVPMLARVAALMVIVRPVPWLEISPPFVSAIAEKKLLPTPICVLPPSPVSLRITPVAPIATAPAALIPMNRLPAVAPSRRIVPFIVAPAQKADLGALIGHVHRREGRSWADPRHRIARAQAHVAVDRYAGKQVVAIGRDRKAARAAHVYRRIADRAAVHLKRSRRHATPAVAVNVPGV